MRDYYESKIPRSTLETLDDYVAHGLATGSFVKAVLSNDLFGAFAQGDKSNLAAIHEIIAFVYNEMPSTCHGSPKHYSAWLERKLAEREASEVSDES